MSYAHQESDDFVGFLHDFFATKSVHAWVDVNEIEMGDDWHDKIGEGINDCMVFLAVITPKYLQSKFCKQELYMAQDMKKAILPVYPPGRPLPQINKLGPGVAYAVQGLQHCHFRDPMNGVNLSDLTQANKQVLDELFEFCHDEISAQKPSIISGQMRLSAGSELPNQSTTSLDSDLSSR